MKSTIIFLLVSGVVATVYAQREQGSWGWQGKPQGNNQGNNRPGQPQGTNRPGQRPQTNPLPAPAPAAPQIDGNGQLIGCPCRTTQETNLVCGTDGLTYGNMGKLKCAQSCKDVQLLHLGSCSARDPFVPVNNGQ